MGQKYVSAHNNHVTEGCTHVLSLLRKGFRSEVEAIILIAILGGQLTVSGPSVMRGLPTKFLRLARWHHTLVKVIHCPVAA